MKFAAIFIFLLIISWYIAILQVPSHVESYNMEKPGFFQGNCFTLAKRYFWHKKVPFIAFSCNGLPKKSFKSYDNSIAKMKKTAILKSEDATLMNDSHSTLFSTVQQSSSYYRSFFTIMEELKKLNLEASDKEEKLLYHELQNIFENQREQLHNFQQRDEFIGSIRNSLKYFTRWHSSRLKRRLQSFNRRYKTDSNDSQALLGRLTISTRKENIFRALRATESRAVAASLLKRLRCLDYYFSPEDLCDLWKELQRIGCVHLYYLLLHDGLKQRELLEEEFAIFSLHLPAYYSFISKLPSSSARNCIVNTTLSSLSELIDISSVSFLMLLLANQVTLDYHDFLLAKILLGGFKLEIPLVLKNLTLSSNEKTAANGEMADFLFTKKCEHEDEISSRTKAEKSLDKPQPNPTVINTLDSFIFARSDLNKLLSLQRHFIGDSAFIDSTGTTNHHTQGLASGTKCSDTQSSKLEFDLQPLLRDADIRLAKLFIHLKRLQPNPRFASQNSLSPLPACNAAISKIEASKFKFTPAGNTSLSAYSHPSNSYEKPAEPPPCKLSREVRVILSMSFDSMQRMLRYFLMIDKSSKESPTFEYDKSEETGFHEISGGEKKNPHFLDIQRIFSKILLLQLIAASSDELVFFASETTKLLVEVFTFYPQLRSGIKLTDFLSKRMLQAAFTRGFYDFVGVGSCDNGLEALKTTLSIRLCVWRSLKLLNRAAAFSIRNAREFLNFLDLLEDLDLVSEPWMVAYAVDSLEIAQDYSSALSLIKRYCESSGGEIHGFSKEIFTLWNERILFKQLEGKEKIPPHQFEYFLGALIHPFSAFEKLIDSLLNCRSKKTAKKLFEVFLSQEKKLLDEDVSNILTPASWKCVLDIAVKFLLLDDAATICKLLKGASMENSYFSLLFEIATDYEMKIKSLLGLEM